jgi:hypothetical protein
MKIQIPLSELLWDECLVRVHDRDARLFPVVVKAVFRALFEAAYAAGTLGADPEDLAVLEGISLEVMYRSQLYTTEALSREKERDPQ